MRMTMILLPVLLLLWGVPLSTATGRLRRFYSIDSKMSINDARNVCRSNYTDLVTIYDEEENNELIGILKKNNINNPSGWIGASSCKWSNGDLVTFTNYSKTFNKEKCCGVINPDGRWDCINCTSTKKYFMCYDQGLGEQSYDYSLIRENRSWFEAQMYCRENHTDLVSIRDKEENDRVKEARNGSDSFWIGLQYNNSLDWFDGGYSDYKQNSSSQGCFTILSRQKNAQGGYWFKINSGSYPALCYKSFIHVSEKYMPWEDARRYCDCNFSGLLRIESENDRIETERELRRRNITEPVWVGLKEIRLWMWTSGLHVVNWSNWKEGSQLENEHCGAIEKVDGQYKWSDANCTKEYRVLCEGE